MTSRLSSDDLRLSSVTFADNAMLRLDGASAIDIPASMRLAESDQAELPAPSPIEEELYVPEHYEPRYAYPLIVWLMNADEPNGAGALRSLIRRISDRNCFGVGVRARAGQSLENHIFETVVRVRRKHHIHTERIYLAGVGDEAALALQTGLSRPEWFGGIVALSATLPFQQRWLTRFDALRGKRVLLGAGRDDLAQVQSIRRLQRVLWSGGLSVRACSYDFREQIDDGVFREINRWMIQAIEEAATAA